MTTALTPLDDVRMSLEKLAPQFKSVLPSSIPPDKFIRVIMTAIQGQPKLLDCDRKTFFAAAMKCATDSLIPDGREAALVPFGNTVQYLPMMAGILKKIRNSGELLTINAQVVFEEDDFDYWHDEEGEHLKHRPQLSGDRGKPKLTYATAKTKDGIYYEVMTEEQIQAVRNVSRSKGGPWDGPFADEMRKKTALRRLSKRLPMSTDVEQIIRADDELYDLSPVKEEDAKPIKSSRLEKLIEKKPLAEPPKEDEPI